MSVMEKGPRTFASVLELSKVRIGYLKRPSDKVESETRTVGLPWPFEKRPSPASNDR